MTATGLTDIKVGDHLILVTGNHYRGDEPVTVSRVGHKYLYVSLDGRERSERFDRITGIEDSQYGAKQRLYTQEQYDESRERATLFASLLAAGIDVKWKVRDSLTTGQLRNLLTVVAPSD